MAKDKEDQIEQPVEDPIAEQLKRLGAELMAVADDEVARTGKLKEVEKVLGGLTVKDFEHLAESSVVQTFVNMLGIDDMKPGEVKNRGTLAERARDWTVSDMYREFEPMTFIPIFSAPVTWNGVGPFYLTQGEEVTVPKPIYDIYRDSLFAQRQAAIHEAYLMGKSDRPPHPNWITDEGASVRGWSLQGEAFGGRRGGHISTGVLNMNEEGQ